MSKRRLGRTELFIDPLVFGCNVLGWTLEEQAAYPVLDAFLDGGFAALDTADSYGKGKSETIIGNWMKARGNRDKVLVFTKVGSDMGQGHRDLSAKWIEEEVDASLRRLQTDYIDLYQTHWPDPATPQQETLEALDKLVKAGKVRYVGSSNQDTALLSEALGISKADGLARYETIQNEFNLYDRMKFEEVQATCVAEASRGSAISAWRAASSPASIAAPPTRRRARAARRWWRNTSTPKAIASSRRWTRSASGPGRCRRRSPSAGSRRSRASAHRSPRRHRSSRCRA